MKLFSFRSKHVPSPAEVTEYRQLCERTAVAINTTGRQVKAYSDPAVPRFVNADDSRKVLESLRAYVDVLESTLAAGDSLNDAKRLVWRMMQRLALTPPADFLDQFNDENVIEIYDTENLQLFRNLIFFDKLYVTVDEISTFVWPRDSKRSVKMSSEGLRLMLLIKTGLLRSTFPIHTMPGHLVTCDMSEGYQEIRVTMKAACPLRSNGRFSAYMTVNLTERL